MSSFFPKTEVKGQRSGNPHEEWPMLSKLEPGVIYEIDNDVYKSGDPRPRFRVKIEDAETTLEP